MLRVKIIALNTYLSKEERPKINNLPSKESREKKDKLNLKWKKINNNDY